LMQCSQLLEILGFFIDRKQELDGLAKREVSRTDGAYKPRLRAHTFEPIEIGRLPPEVT
jgi:hypothetical protein